MFAKLPPELWLIITKHLGLAELSSLYKTFTSAHLVDAGLIANGQATELLYQLLTTGAKDIEVTLKSSPTSNYKLYFTPRIYEGTYSEEYICQRKVIGQRWWNSSFHKLKIRQSFTQTSKSTVRLNLSTTPWNRSPEDFRRIDTFEVLSAQVSFSHPKVGIVQMEYGKRLWTSSNTTQNETHNTHVPQVHANAQNFQLTRAICWPKNSSRSMTLPKHWFDILGAQIQVSTTLERAPPICHSPREDCQLGLKELSLYLLNIPLPVSSALLRLFPHDISESQITVEEGRDSRKLELES